MSSKFTTFFKGIFGFGPPILPLKEEWGVWNAEAANWVAKHHVAWKYLYSAFDGIKREAEDNHSTKFTISVDRSEFAEVQAFTIPQLDKLGYDVTVEETSAGYLVIIRWEFV